MLRNSYICALIIITIFIEQCQPLQCHNGLGSSGNETLDITDDKSLTDSCIILKDSASDNWKYSLDKDHMCQNKQDNAHHYICREEVMVSFYCCSWDLCNKEHFMSDISGRNFTCTRNSSEACSTSYCVNTTFENSGGIIINTTIDCFYDQSGYIENATELVLLPNGDTRKELLHHFSTTCDNNVTTQSTLPHVKATTTTLSSVVTDEKNGFSVSVVIGAVLVLATGLMLVGVGVKKCYERHLNKRLEYSYAQLTIDMLDDDDDHLILP